MANFDYKPGILTSQVLVIVINASNYGHPQKYGLTNNLTTTIP